MRILCNLPLECFDDRSSFDGIELLTFGPGAPRWIDGSWYPFDVVFDPSTEGLGTLLSRLPPGFAPDLLLFYWPDQEPLPADLEAAPCPVVGVLSDYNLSLPYVTGLWTCFDTLLVDRAGVDLFRRLSFHDTRYFCQFTFKRGSHRVFPEVERDLDLAFAGNLNPAVQRERSAWLPRLLDLQRHGLRVEVRNQVFGADYGRFLNRARIGFNRSIRGEMNLRAFEVPACGAALLMEASNLEVREFLVPGEEVVLYGDDDF
ncbi:MAG: glycosyltransferase family 1 protein, partial [Planctomycetes bacterium]|nr:glycosyltransferase family 1 protein [Planctomycetota bacterium]